MDASTPPSKAAREKDTALAEMDPATAPFQGLAPSDLARPNKD